MARVYEPIMVSGVRAHSRAHGAALKLKAFKLSELQTRCKFVKKNQKVTISQKRCEIGPRLLLITNRKLYSRF